MRVRDCYPCDVVKIKGRVWSIGHMVPSLPNYVQADCDSNNPPEDSVSVLPLDMAVEEVVSRGFNPDMNLNEIGYLELLIRQGVWKPLRETKIEEMDREEMVLFSKESLSEYKKIVEHLEVSGCSWILPEDWKGLIVED